MEMPDVALLAHCFPVKLELRMLVFCGRRQTREPGEKPSEPSTPLIKPDYVIILHTNAAPQFLWKPNHMLLLAVKNV